MQGRRMGQTRKGAIRAGAAPSENADRSLLDWS